MANSAKSAMLLVKHSPKLQEIVYNFAKNLDITHKIWSDLIDFRRQSETIRSESIINAIYYDNYRIKNEQIILGENTNQNEPLELKIFNQEILNDCKRIFEDHYLLAMQNLEMLEKESSEPDAVASLKSILNIMKNCVCI